MNRVFIPRLSNNRRTRRAANYEPSSERVWSGTPHSMNRFRIRSSTSSLVSRRPTWIVRHSLAGQRTRLEQTAQSLGYDLLEIIEEVESGAKERDGLKEAQARIDAGEAEGLIFPKLDRIGRSQIHLAALVKWAQDSGVTLLSTDEGMMVEEGVLRNEALPFLIALAQVERERISRRTKEGLAAARAKGVVLGAPAENVGELSERATELRRRGRTLQEIADLFNAEGHRTARGAEFAPVTVYRMINRVDPAANPEGGHRGKAVAAAA